MMKGRKGREERKRAKEGRRVYEGREYMYMKKDKG